MAGSEAEIPASGTPLPADRRIAFESLRERTDELELIISGLTVFALFALPGIMLSAWMDAQVHLEGETVELLRTMFMFASGLSYALGMSFVAHLAVRAYWVGLIGLKAAFPRGVRWEETLTMGSVGRDFYRKRLPDIDAAIDRADRIASIIFALASLVAILIVWSAFMVVVAVLLMLLIESATGISDVASGRILIGAIALLVGLSTVNWLLDTRVFGRRAKAADDRPGLRRWLIRSMQLTNAVMPQRLILPVQLTLQSNLPTRRFVVALTIAIALVPIVGSAAVMARIRFAPLNSYQFFDDSAAEAGLRSAYYESMRGEDDLALRVPVIASDRVADAYLRVFLPHLPGRDNVLLRQACPASLDGDRSNRSATAACLSTPWQVKVDGRDVALAEFVPAERRDLGMRGLQGYLPLAGLLPGRHDLDIVWNAAGPSDGNQRRIDYRIPFWFAPAYEIGLEPSRPSR